MIRKIVLTVLFLQAVAVGTAQTKVYLIPTLHGLHKTNSLYGYDSLRAILSRIHPDVLAVEIRPEDIGADTGYLKSNYPLEMWMSRFWFPSLTLEGFDWLGPELQGRPIPNRYWKDSSRIKALEQLLQTDTLFSTRLKTCDMYTEERLSVLKNQSLRSILRSNDAILTKVYYNCLNTQLQGTDYGELTRFYDDRNKHMQENLGRLIERYPQKKLVVLTGDDHYPYLLEYLRKQNIVLTQPY